MARLGIDRDFLWEFGKLERAIQEKVHASFAKFEQATHAGVHLEKINNVRDARLRSIRIDQSWRGIVLAPESGDSYTLLKVLPHDDAYDWACRRRVSVNRATGVIEVRDVAAIEERLPQLTEDAKTSASRLLDGVGDADLGRLGIDGQVLPFARVLTDLDQLESARGILPEPQYDVLVGLAIGMTPEQVWEEMAGAGTVAIEYDTSDVTAAVARSPERVVLVSGPDELMEVFSYPFALWRIYLHPTQHRMAHGCFRGSARVTGGPGTGKTVVALHRARHLAESSAGDRSVLVTTFTKTLAGSLEDSLRILIDNEALLRRVDVRHIDQIAYQVTASRHGRLQVLPHSEERDRWKRLITQFGLSSTEAFLSQEWRHVVLAQGIMSRDEYLTAARSGRGRPLGTRARTEIWPALAGFDAELRAEGQWTYETICVEATRLLELAESKQYRHIIVDEAQDLSPWQWRMLRAAVRPGPDDLFLVGDTHQRIYDHRVSFKQVGIDITGRSERLKINYRTTAEILGWSLGLLRGERIDDMNENLETLAGCRSEVHGAPPILLGASTRSAEMVHFVTAVRNWLDDGVQPGQVGVAARSSMLVDEAVAALVASGFPAVSLAKRAAREGEVAVATMHRMKGLEFRCVAVIGVGQHQVPAPAAVTSATDDQRSHDLDIQRERCLLFVACTRARENLLVSWHGTPSPLLPT
ncbi:MAG: DNA helicase [Pseudonocardiales bacterium]|nr:MAG: DNA helicase [Pseudonocardiales bacterium]